MSEVPTTGQDRVDRALAGMAHLDGLELHERPAVYEQVLSTLESVLSDEPGTAAP